MRFLSVILFLFFTTVSLAQSSTYYATRYNNFAQLNHSKNATINDDCLNYDNTTATMAIVTDTTDIDIFSNYKYYIRFANKHNKEGKSYKVKDCNNKTISIESPKCGIVFNVCPDNYWIVTVSAHNTSLYNESVDNRYLKLELAKICGDKVRIVESATIDKHINLDDSYNYLGVNIEDSTIKVLAGNDKSHNMTQEEMKMKEGHQDMKVGYAVGPGALISIERAVLTVSHITQPVNLDTHWTKEALDMHFANSKDPYEGYWTYLDRDMEDQWLRLGGRYTIALVNNGHGYDVIYVDGAQVKKSQWHSGMKKAELSSTIFTDNFTGMWYDATMSPINEDVFVTFESGVILNFKFPVYKSQIRFSKVLNE